MIGTQQTLPNMKPRCVGLFSEHYVKRRFPETAEYKKMAPPKGLKENIQTLIDKNIKTVAQKNEAQLEDDLIRPILNALGIHYIVAVNVPGGQEADYAFFGDEKTRAEADARDKEKYKGASALADAKRWGRELDKGGGTALDKNPNAIPTKQIANYIQDTATDWGVLTDGRLWRVYNRNTPPVSQSFFEINLPEALLDDDAFHLFYALFSGPAFARGVQELVRRESGDYWAEIGEDLKEKAYKALELLCNGFRNLDAELEIKDIYEGSVILLYRLLFILYAENKNLLPRGEDAYKRYSLQEILNEVDRGAPETFSENRSMLYDRLRHLFRLIDEGDASLKVPQYNGGLFKEDGLPFLPAGFLSKYAVPDRYLAGALALIAFAQDKKGRTRHQVDYGELDVRHLGSIYEGLLEFHPTLKDDRIELYTDKGERKATGSYYTPEYIVDYIVENTLGPLTEKMATPDAVLGIKVLDPAMGSGHFLVGAVDYVGRRCVEYAGAEAEKTEKEYQRDAVERCIYGVDLNPLAVELAKLSLWLHTVAKDKPLSFLDHHLKLGNSLVGARVDDLGEVPRKNKKNEAAPTQNLFATRLEQAMPNALNEVMGILARGTDAIEDVEVKETLLRTAQERLKPFQAVADTWVSTYFGNDVTADEYAAALASISRPKELLSLPIVAAATALSHGDEHGVGREFFHWELEFPEVFFDEHGREKDHPGFDAVIGNPPYGSKKMLDEFTKGFIRKNNSCLSSSDTAEMFLELSFNSIKYSGKVGMIVPKPLTYITSWKDIRRSISELALKNIIDVSKAFKEVKLEQIIIIFENSHASGSVKTGYLEENVNLVSEEILQNEFNERVYPLYRFGAVAELASKLEKYYVNLGDICRIWSGIGGITRYLTKDSTKELIMKGASLKRYGYTEDLYYIDSSFSNAGDREEHAPKRVICQDIVAHIKSPRDHIEIMATIAETGLLTQETVINFTVPEESEYDVLFLLALINSKLFSWYAYNLIFNKAIRTMHYRPNYADFSPLRPIFFRTAATARGVLAQELVNSYNAGDFETIISSIGTSLPKNDEADFLAFVEGAIGDEEKSDVVHDFLAFLAQQMLDTNAAKQRLVREFLGWLDGETAGNLDDFRPKKYQEFWEYEFDEFYKWLNKNHEDFKAADHGKLQGEFDKYKAELVALTEKIERTDRLIDDIVYILYGLTEEEIEIVESSFRGKSE